MHATILFCISALYLLHASLILAIHNRHYEKRVAVGIHVLIGLLYAAHFWIVVGVAAEHA